MPNITQMITSIPALTIGGTALFDRCSRCFGRCPPGEFPAGYAGIRRNMKAVIIMGPPGSGKSTQARLLADKIDYVHLDTGAYLESVLYDPANAKNKEIAEERRAFEKGELLTPSWVLKIVKKRVEELARAKTGVIFSGSPRTLYEAFGDKNHVGLMQTFEKGYGRKNIVVFELKIRSTDSIGRNSHRLICSSCRSPLLKTERCRFEIGGSCPLRRKIEGAGRSTMLKR